MNPFAYLHSLWADPVVRALCLSAVMIGILTGLLEGGKALYLRLKAQRGTLPQEVAHALWNVLIPLYQLTEQELKETQLDLRALKVQEIAKDLYSILPDTISVRYQGLLVPIPIKTILTEQLFLAIVTASLKDADHALDTLEALLETQFGDFARRGLTTESLLRYATPLKSAS